MVVGDPSAALMALYDAVGDVTAWDTALDAAVECLGCTSAVLTIEDRAPGTGDAARPYELAATSRRFRENADVLAEYYARFAATEAQEFAYCLHAEPRRIVTDGEIYPDIRRLRFRGDFHFRRKHFGVYRRFGVRLNGDRRWSEHAFFQLGPEHETIPVPILDGVETFVPHMAKVVELGRTFVELRRRYQALLGVLDRVGVGLALVRADGAVIIANEEARRVFDADKGVGLSREGRLAIDDADIAAAVAKAVAGAVRTASGQNDIAEFRVLLDNERRSSPESRLLLEVTPIRDTFDELGAPEQHALLALIDPDVTTHVSIDRLALVHRLSATESAVCRLLVDGHTYVEVAEILAVSPETVKRQTVSILAKTAARSRVELVALALRTSPPILT